MKYIFESEQELREWVAKNVLTSSEAREILDLSRATFSSLVSRNMIEPVKAAGGTHLFMLSDIESRKKSAKPGRPKA